MADKLLEVTDEFDATQKQIRLKAISGDPDSAHAVAVDGSASTQPVSGTVTSTLGVGAAQPLKAEDAIHSSGDYGIMALGVRQDTPASLAGASGDYVPPIFDSTGKMWTETELYDTQIGKAVKVSPMRSLSTGTPNRLVGTSFSGAVRDANFWTDATNGTGASVTQANQAILQCGTDAAGYAVVTSVRKSRYVSGSANFFRAVVQMPVAGLANSIQRWGAFTTATRVPQDGFFFEMVGTTLNLNYVKGNSTNPPTANRVASSSWTVPFTIDTNVHTYEIHWTNSKVWFYVDDLLRHTISASTAPLTATYDLPISLQNISVTSTTNFVLNVRAASIWRFGEFETAPTYYHVTGALTAQVLKYGAGVLHLVSVNNPSAQAITLYDAVTGTNAIAIITPVANSSPFTLDFHVPFNTGLAVTVAGTIDATIIYE